MNGITNRSHNFRRPFSRADILQITDYYETSRETPSDCLRYQRCTYEMVPNNTANRPLQLLSRGLFKAIFIEDKTFVVYINHKLDVVPIYRHKDPYAGHNDMLSIQSTTPDKKPVQEMLTTDLPSQIVR